MDFDLADISAPAKAPAKKPGKFAPKNSKFKPVAKPKIEPDTSGSIPVTVPKVEIDDSPATVVSMEIEQPVDTVRTSHDANVSVKNGTDATDMEIDNGRELDEEEDKVVREINVFFTSSTDANSKVNIYISITITTKMHKLR